MMELRELKKEVYELADLEKLSKNFQDNWIKPIKSNTNTHLPFLQNLAAEIKLELNQRLKHLHENWEYIKSAQVINQKLAHHIRYLIELKLTTFNGDSQKSKLITNSLLNDDFFNLKQTIHQVQELEKHLGEFSQGYQELNEFLHPHLSLEEGIFFSELPHQKHLQKLKDTSQQQKKIIKHLGNHFLHLVKETQLQN